jgi:hypothetical protein
MHTSSTCGCTQSGLEMLAVSVRDLFIGDPNGRLTTCNSDMLQQHALATHYTAADVAWLPSGN